MPQTGSFVGVFEPLNGEQPHRDSQQAHPSAETRRTAYRSLKSFTLLHNPFTDPQNPILFTSRSFRVRCNNTFSTFYTCSCGIPQGSVLGPLLFTMCTTPLSTLISSLSLNHHLYADDTQLFFSFTRPTSTQASPTCKMPFSKSLPG